MKHIRRVIALLIAFSIVVMFAGCGKSSAAGVYCIKTINGQPYKEAMTEALKEMYGDSVTIDDYMETMKKRGYSTLEESYSFEFKKDESAVMIIAGIEQYKGKWKQDGDKIIMTLDTGGDYEFTINGNELTFSDSPDNVMVFVKK